VLDAAGFRDTRIFASGGLDEDEIARCVDAGAPIDAYGVGTRMDVSADAPYLDMAYKLVRCDGRDVLKTSPGKATWAGPVMRAGDPLRAHPSLDAIRDHCAAAIRGLDDTVTRLRDPAPYPVRYSDRLVAHQRALEVEVRG